mgnify:FL=1
MTKLAVPFQSKLMIHDGYEVVSVSPVSTFVKQKSETEGTLSPSPCCKL